VPVYVLEFLLGRYCASDDPAAIATGLAVVNQTLQENFVRPDESEKAKAELKRKGKHRLIDKVDVRLVPSEDKFWAHLANFGDRYVNIPDDASTSTTGCWAGGSGASWIWSTASPTTKPTSGRSTSRPSGPSRSPPLIWLSTRLGAPASAVTTGSTS
jgi:predicted ATP-dependent Lon-type protease